MIQVVFNLEETKEVEITMTDLAGQSLIQDVQAFPTGRAVHEIDISRLPSGTYFVKVRTDHGAISRKVIKE